MKHQAKYRKLGRNLKHRWAMLRNMVTSLFQHERIKTTLPKAKELKRVADRMITLGKKGDYQAKLSAGAVIRDQKVLDKLFSDLAQRYKERPGGYTRVAKIGFRDVDASDMAIIELVDRQGEIRPAKPVKGSATSSDVSKVVGEKLAVVKQENKSNASGLKGLVSENEAKSA